MISKERYELWRAPQPCFAPGDPPSTLIADGSPPECNTDGDQITCTDAGAAGDVDTNYFYILRAFDAMEQWVDADGVGEFDFGLVAGN